MEPFVISISGTGPQSPAANNKWVLTHHVGVLRTLSVHPGEALTAPTCPSQLPTATPTDRTF